MSDDDLMETLPNQLSDVEKYRSQNESDEQWSHRRSFIKRFQNDYDEERLLCLSQCYANMVCLGCKYSEPLNSLLEDLSKKLKCLPETESIVRESSGAKAKKSKMMSDLSDSFMMGSSNFISFSTNIEHPSNQYVSSSLMDSSQSPLIYETTDLKETRLRYFATDLREFTRNTRQANDADPKDRAIEDIYQIGNQHRLFIDYRPENLNEVGSTHRAHSSYFLPKTFYGKLYIDEVLICTGHGTNKRLCKRNCFQQALERFLNEDLYVKSITGRGGQQFYELANKSPQFNEMTMSNQMDMSINSSKTMTETIKFVEAHDKSTIAGQTARQQNQAQFSQYWGRGVPFREPERMERQSVPPPPPVPHQPARTETSTFIEAASTTTKSVSKILNQMKPSTQNQHEVDLIDSILHKSRTDGVCNIQLGVTEDKLAKAEPIRDEGSKGLIYQERETQKMSKLNRIKLLLFNLLNVLPDPSHAIDLISTQINKYQLNAEFECADKQTVNGFHGYLVIEQIVISDGYGINRKLSKKQTYTRALTQISPAKSFSLAPHDGARWSLVCHADGSGVLKAPPTRPTPISHSETQQSHWMTDVSASAATSSKTSAVRHYYERIKEQSHHNANTGVCIPPPVSIEKTTVQDESKKKLNTFLSSDDQTIIHNIRRLLPNTFVIFELMDFDQKIPGHYVSMLFISMAKNKLDLKFEYTLVPNGYMVTLTIDDQFLMSWIAPTKVAAKQAAAKKVIEILQTIYPSIKTKTLANDSTNNEYDAKGLKQTLITRAQIYSQDINKAIPIQSSNSSGPKEDVGLKLLKKMGWTGGGIGKDLQGIETPIEIEDIQGRKGLGSSTMYPNQNFLKNLRRILETFIAENLNDGELVFSAEFSSDERRAIHREAMKLHLTSTSYNHNGERRIRIVQKRNLDQLVDHLLMNGGETARYEFKTQKEPMHTVQRSSSTSYNQIAPPGYQSMLPDACDDGF